MFDLGVKRGPGVVGLCAVPRLLPSEPCGDSASAKGAAKGEDGDRRGDPDLELHTASLRGSRCTFRKNLIPIEGWKPPDAISRPRLETAKLRPVPALRRERPNRRLPQ